MALTMSISCRARPCVMGASSLRSASLSKTVRPMARSALRVSAIGKKDLVDKVHQETGLPWNDCNAIIVSALENIKEAVVEGDKVSIVGFGSFLGRDRKARTGRNPKTGAPIDISATYVPAFSPSKVFKDAAKEKFLARGGAKDK